MKVIKSIVICLVLMIITTVGFTQGIKANHNTDDSKIALQGYSPVSYLDLALAQKGLKEYKSMHNELAYYFTTKDQKSKFDAAPEKYLPQYGGYCAFGIQSEQNSERTPISLW